MAVRIVTDSSCDLSREDAAAHDVEIVPLSIRFGDSEYIDGVDLSVDEFYEKLATAATLPETAAPAPGRFEEAFRRAVEQGADEIVCINISSDLSATMQSAQNAARALEGTARVEVIDSRSITMGLGSQVLAASEAARGGADADAVVDLVNDMVKRTHVMGALDTLENLRKGGRIGGAQALLGNLLSIKPLLDVSSGRVEEAGKARTRKKALHDLAQKVLTLPSVERLYVCHGNAPDLDEFLTLLGAKYPRDTIGVTKIGPVIGVHGGPRMMGVTWLDPA